MKISEGCPQYFRSMSNENIRGLSIVFSKCFPHDFQSVSNENIGGLSTVFSECA